MSAKDLNLKAERLPKKEMNRLKNSCAWSQSVFRVRINTTMYGWELLKENSRGEPVLEQIISNDLLRNVILPRVAVRTLMASCSSVCSQWHIWMSKAFWETVYKTQFGSYKIQIIPPITNLDYRRMSIEASQIPRPGTLVSISGNARAEVIEDVVYSTALKMRKYLTGEILDLDIPFFRPMLKPGKDGNPQIAEGLRVFGMWKKQSFWSGTLKRVDPERREVDINWEDNDKGTISFDEVYVYPTEQQVLELQDKIAKNELDPKTHVFASRTNLVTTGRCGPYHEGTMDHLSCHWSVILADGTTVVPSAVTERQQMSLEAVNKKVNNMIDKMLIGQKVLYKNENEQIYYEGEVSADPENFCSLMVRSEDKKEGLLELKVYYSVRTRDWGVIMLPADSIARVSKPITRDIKEGISVFVPLNGGFVPAAIRAVYDFSSALVAYELPGTYPVNMVTIVVGVPDMYKQILV